MRSASFSLLTILCLLLAVAPATADTLYSNGPINGTTDAWTISNPYSVSDSFTLDCFFVGCILKDLHIGVWLFPGDSVSSVQMQLGNTPFGNDIADTVLAATGSTDLGINQYGYDIQQVDFSFHILVFGSGTGWVTLSNANSTNRDVVYWDENSGPSSAFENSVGSIPSEAFTVTGEHQEFVPEPSSIMLFGSGILGLAGVLRRRLNI